MRGFGHERFSFEILWGVWDDRPQKGGITPGAGRLDDQVFHDGGQA